MAYTLISTIGTGMYKDPKKGIYDGYQKTEYIFSNGFKFETRLFSQAVLKSRKDINQLILLGTNTSSWDCLVTEDANLWETLVAECESEKEDKRSIGVTRENLDRLEKYLSERLCIDVVIKAHSDKIDDNTSEEIFNCYTNVIKEYVKDDNNILFDITHGFRSMPVLQFQAFQYSLSKFDANRNVEIIYGEYNNISKKGYARSLSSYWKYSELSAALDVFESKLDGSRLADLVKNEWEDGSEVVRKFSEIVKANFAFQIFGMKKKIAKALLSYPQNASTQLSKVKEILEPIVSLIDKNDKPRSLRNYSKFLYDHHLYVQAVITLQVAVEASFVAKYGTDADYGDYEWWQNKGKSYYRDDDLRKLEYFRNQVAHGGNKDKKTDEFPQVIDIQKFYENGLRGVENLFKELGL